ncbi:ATP-binding protein [Aestuariirhabdus sp. Z084]|uniref:PAS domain-containing sensor histidine kinase n=1 Tax=Aestuariirhabdus haliotis TaxID=2918751 RepID=UPI00201B3E66|nr:ATP-binding protein [Aestuariirhabdus haliotis]MCL6415141.1 ATP-binding protein [Aestuariirhabdus haliotis]MCL6420016.1 ATP-binding protein [Aestuariirhabdus haliotis]
MASGKPGKVPVKAQTAQDSVLGSDEAMLCPMLDHLDAGTASEDAWLEVIAKMEQVYSELITHQVALEEKNTELESAYQFISSVQTAMTDLLLVCDENELVCQVNRALEKFTGLQESELLGQPLSGLFCEESQSLLRDLLKRIPLAPVYDCELNIKGRYGRVPLSINGARRSDNPDSPGGVVLIGRHIGELRRAYDELNRSHAELKLAQQQLIGSEKMASLGRLVAGVAHELNNPVSFVYGNTHALEGYSKRLQAFFDGLDNAENAQKIQQLREELRIDRLIDDLPSLLEGSLEGVERVRDIVSDLHQFSSGAEQTKAPYDLVRVIETAVRWVSRDLDDRVQLDMPASLTLQGHAGHVQQLLMNLLQNALDAVENEPNPLILIKVSLVQDQVLCTVQDNGPGIDDTDLPHLFEPFFTTKEIGKGTGLGLALSYNFALEQGGDLQADNNPQRGALFTLTLPLN